MPDDQTSSVVSQLSCRRPWRPIHGVSHEDYFRPHPPSQLRRALTQTLPHDYNEIVVPAEIVRRRLPASVEAIFYLKQSKPGEMRAARLVHEAFLAVYGLSSAQVPLLELDLQSSGSAPFLDVSRCQISELLAEAGGV